MGFPSKVIVGRSTRFGLEYAAGACVSVLENRNLGLVEETLGSYFGVARLWESGSLSYVCVVWFLCGGSEAVNCPRFFAVFYYKSPKQGLNLSRS